MAWALQGYLPLRYKVFQKKNSENFIDYLPPSKNGMTESVSMQNLFHTMVVNSKQPIEKISICY